MSSDAPSGTPPRAHADLRIAVEALREARRRVVLASTMVDLEAAVRELTARALTTGLALADALLVGDVHLAGAQPAPSVGVLDRGAAPVAALSRARTDPE